MRIDKHIFTDLHNKHFKIPWEFASWQILSGSVVDILSIVANSWWIRSKFIQKWKDSNHAVDIKAKTDQVENNGIGRRSSCSRCYHNKVYKIGKGSYSCCNEPKPTLSMVSLQNIREIHVELQLAITDVHLYLICMMRGCKNVFFPV